MGNQLTEGQAIAPGGFLMNPNRSAVLVMQYDGNLVLYRVSDHAALWATNTAGQKIRHAIAQRGNLIMYHTDGSVAWTSAWDADWKWGNGTVILQNDGDLVVRSGTTNTWNTKTYGLRYKTDNDHSGFRPLHILDDPTQVLGDAVHLIPGVDWAGEQLKDFANSTGGKILLVAFTTAAYYATSDVLAVYTAMAPQIASLTFAIPGLAKGDSFAQAWVTEWAERVKKTIQMIGGEAGEVVGKKMLEEVGPAVTKLMEDPAFKPLVEQFTKGSETLTSIAKKLNIREDVAQAALDAVSQKVSSFASDVIQGFEIGGIIIPDVPAQNGSKFDPITGVQSNHITFSMAQINQVNAAPVKAEKVNTNALIAAMLSSYVPSGLTATQAQAKIDSNTAARKAAETLHAQMIASSSKLEGYFAKYTALAKK